MVKALKILLTEDNTADAYLIIDYLKECKNISIDHETTLKSTIEKLYQKEYDILLLDLSLPESQGKETYEIIKKHHPEQAIIIITGYPQDILNSYTEDKPSILNKNELTQGQLKETIKKLVTMY